MSKKLEVQRLKHFDYGTLKTVSQGFQKPVICSFDGNEQAKLQQLQSDIFTFNTYRNQEKESGVFNDSRSEDTISSVTKDYKVDQVMNLFLTNDKVISPIKIESDAFQSLTRQVTDFFFSNPILKKRLADTSFLQKAILFLFLQKGIFGKFKPSNLSNFVNVNYSVTNGNTNTVVHSDSGLCNFFTQVEGSKRWWLASPYQRKDLIQSLFQSDITQLDLDDASFHDLEYYDVQLNPYEMLYVPSNWLHGVVATPGKNLSFYCRFPMPLGDMVKNLLYWRAMGVPVNRYKVTDESSQETAADLAEKQANAIGQGKYYMQKHTFATREILQDEPEYVVGLYDVDRVAKAIAGAE